jgi:Flp pilus assembly protein TadG
MKQDPRRGQSLAEFALVLPIVLLLFMALFDLGRAVYAYNTVSNATRAALRVAIVDQDPGVVEAKAREQAVALADSEVTVDVTGVYDPTCRKIGCPTKVGIEYAWTAITPIIGSLIGPISLRAESAMPIERIFDSVP